VGTREKNRCKKDQQTRAFFLCKSATGRSTVFLDRDGRDVSAKTTMRDEARDSTHVVSRALVLSNGALGAEGQCLGLARALGFHDPEVHLVGEAALALAPRFSAAWSEKVGVDGARDGTRDRALALSVGAAQMVRRARRRDHPMPRACSAAAKLLRLLPASLHVRLHALWERVFGARFDDVWLGADLAQVTAALRNLPRNSGRKAKTLVLASGRGAIPAAAAVRRRHADDAFVVVAQHPRVSLAAFDAVVAPKHDFANAKKNASRFFLRADDSSTASSPPRSSKPRARCTGSTTRSCDWHANRGAFSFRVGRRRAWRWRSAGRRVCAASGNRRRSRRSSSTKYQTHWTPRTLKARASRSARARRRR
jgi:hypothetical protein